MRTSTVSTLKIFVCALTTAVAGGACSGTKTSTPISGLVLAEANGALAQARVTVVTSGTTVQSGSDGSFTLPASLGAPGDVVPLSIQADGYARQFRSVRVPALGATNPKVLITLRPHDRLETVTLPSGDNPALAVQITRDDSTLTLSIPADSLVTPAGSLATGTAKVAITYWHAGEDLSSAPGPLIAEASGGALQALDTFGMADIEVTQGSDVLQVAAGKHLTLDIGAPAALRSLLAVRGLTVTPPNLYSLSIKTGLWVQEGTLADGTLAYDGQTFSATLRHLSAWNVDADLSTSNGGCVQGHVKNKCGTSLANKPVIVWFMGGEQVKDFKATTDANGNYCIPTPLTTFGQAQQNTHYFVSGADPTDTNMCNPAPASCTASCPYETSWDGSIPYCSACRYSGESALPVGNQPVTFYTDPCNSPRVTLDACHFCPGQVPSSCTVPNYGAVTAGTPVAGCSQLAELVTTEACAPAAAPDVCTTAAAKHEGDSCGPTDTCCPRADLTCADRVCVPTTEHQKPGLSPR